MAKVRADGFRGVVVVPFTPSDPAWPTLAAAASCTSVAGQRDPCVIVPNSSEYAREGDDLSGAQLLAVMAVDFSRWSRRSFEGLAPPCAECGRQRESRASLLLQGSSDAHDRLRIAAALLRLARPWGSHKQSLGDQGL